MAEVPQINSLLYVSVRDTNFRTRIEDMDEEVLTIGAPLGAGDLDLPEDGTELMVFWTGPRVRYVLPVQMLGVTRERPRRWRLRALGEPVRQTRRRFVRAGGGGLVDFLTVDGRSTSGFVAAEVVDVSEAGLRCRLVSPDQFRGERAVVRLRLAEHALEIGGDVTTLRSATDGPGDDLILTYSVRESEAQAIRRYIFQWEIAERRSRQGLD